MAQKGIRYIEHDVSVDRRAAEEMVSRTGQMGVPVILVDGEAVVGFNRSRLEELLGAGAGGSVTLGLSVADAGSISRADMRREQRGVYIGGVKDSSPGARAGLAAGDIITEINSVPLYSAADLERIVSSLHRGDRVSFRINRGYDYLTSEVVV